MSNEEAQHRETDREIRLEKIMRPAVTVTPDTTEREALEVLIENEIPGVSVVNEQGLLVGFVTDGHLLGSAMPDYLKIMEDVSFVSEAGDEWIDYFAGSADRPVKEVMTTEVASVDVKDSEIVAAHKMVHQGASSVVVTDQGKVVGIVNRLDLYSAIINASSD